MDTLEMMQVYCRVVESGSFTRAVEQMSLPKAVVSKYIHELEGQGGLFKDYRIRLQK